MIYLYTSMKQCFSKKNENMSNGIEIEKEGKAIREAIIDNHRPHLQCYFNPINYREEKQC